MVVGGVALRLYKCARPTGQPLVLAPSLVVLDMMFGGEDRGWHFLQRLRLDRQAALVPVIVCTAAVRLARDAQDYFQDMGIGIVLKPFDIDDLVATVDRALAEPVAAHQ